jgi:hypothetical protein
MGKMSLDRLSKPGDIIIEQVTVTSYTGFSMNVRGQLVGLTIYEDIYNNTLSGQLILNDAMAMVKHFPLVGNEKVNIVFYLPGDEVETVPVNLTFKVFNVSSHTKTTTDNSKFAVLELVSIESDKGNANRFSRSFTGMTYDDMVLKIMREQVLGESQKNNYIHTTPTIGLKNLVVPYWNPFYTINWIAKKSISKNDFTHCDYVFYQTLNGIYHFVPLSFLKTYPPTAKYTHIPGGSRTEAGDMPIEQYLRNVRNMNIVAYQNRLKSIATGIYASSMISFDATTKDYDRHFYNYQKEWPRETSVSEFPIVSFPNENLSQYTSSVMKMLPKHSEQYDGYPINDNVEAYALRRQSLMNRMNTQTLRLEVPGDSRIHVGDIIELEVPAFEETKNKDEYRDTQLSGKYMITSIKHVILDDEYTMEMIVSKDSYDYQLPDYKEESLKTL